LLGTQQEKKNKKIAGQSHFNISTLREVFNDAFFRSDYTAGGGQFDNLRRQGFWKQLRRETSFNKMTFFQIRSLPIALHPTTIRLFVSYVSPTLENSFKCRSRAVSCACDLPGNILQATCASHTNGVREQLCGTPGIKVKVTL